MNPCAVYGFKADQPGQHGPFHDHWMDSETDELRHSFFCSFPGCGASTGDYASEAEAASAWNAGRVAQC
jgi:hypothetical protein